MEHLYVKNNKIFTQIGSVPFDNTKEAIEYSLEHRKKGVAFLPEVTKLGDAMLNYIKNPGKLSCLNDFSKEKFETVKIQCVGPLSCVSMMRREIAEYTEDDAVIAITEHISSILSKLNAKEYIIFLDEPMLGDLYDRKDFYDLFNLVPSHFNSVFDKKIIWGVHVCGTMDWKKLFDSKIDIISFNASNNDITLNYSKRNKKVAWGIEQESDIKDWKQGDLITLPCGIDTKTSEEAYKSLDMLLKAAEGFSQKI